MIDSDCPRQKAFLKQLKYLFKVRDDVNWRNDDSMKEHYQNTYIYFVNLWCPAFIEYQGCQMKKSKENDGLNDAVD